MKIIHKLVLILAVLLAACNSAPSDDAVQITIAQTQAAEPTNTPPPPATDTPAPTPTPLLSEIDLVPILLQAGDFPSDFVLGTVRSEIPDLKFFADLGDAVPTPDAVTWIDVEDQGSTGIGGYQKNRVAVMLYSDIDIRNQAYDVISTSPDLGTPPITELQDVGENAVITDVNLLSGYRYVVFIRCSAVVYIQTTADIENYARRLDGRLSEVICP